MKFYQEFLRSIAFNKNNTKLPKFSVGLEKWRENIPPHEDTYMQSIYSYHFEAFKNGKYTIISPFTGSWVSSCITLLSRGGGHTEHTRGNSSIFIIWGFLDTDNTIFYLGSMDVFGWFTHIISCRQNFCKLLIPVDNGELYKPNFELRMLDNIAWPALASNYDEKKKMENRSIIIGGSESAGHAVWNDLSGLLTYMRYASASGLMLRSHRISHSILSFSLPDSALYRISNQKIMEICDSTKLDLGEFNSLLVIPTTAFRPLDFIINLKRFNSYLEEPSQTKAKLKQSTSKKTINLWVNLRSPIEIKRDICINYIELIQTASTRLKNHHKFEEITLTIDGWTGRSNDMGFTNKAEKHHHALARAMVKECNSLFEKIFNLVGCSMNQKIKHALAFTETKTKTLSICQYGSGTIYGSVCANDAAIVIDRNLFKGVGAGNDALLGRKDNVYPCKLKLIYLVPSCHQTTLNHNCEYTKILASMSDEINKDINTNYTVDKDKFTMALDIAMSMQVNEFRYLE